MDCYYNGEALWLAYEKQYDILILDVEMTGIDGVHLAENIRKTDEEVVIILRHTGSMPWMAIVSRHPAIL